MNKKIFSFLFSTVIVLGISNPLFGYSLINDSNQESTKESDEYTPLKWKQEMDDILTNESDYSGEYVDYSQSSQTYYLKQDIDYTSMIENKYSIYDEKNVGINLIDGSTFNGNNHQIKNRYDQDQLQVFMEDNDSVFKSFKTGEDTKVNDLYLFSPINDEKILNLTFNNSPFVISKTTNETLLHNVNLENINISNLELSLSSSDDTPLEKQNSFSIGLLAFELSANTILENSSFNNIVFSDNKFTLDQTKTGGKVGLNITLSLVNFISSTNTITFIPIRFSELEYNNWTIENNIISTDKWVDTFENHNAITFTPFFIGGANFLSDGFEKEISEEKNNSFSSNVINGTKENNVIINDIYFNHFTIKNNIGILNEKETNAFNFILLPMFNDDDIIYISYKTIIINNMDFESDNLYAENFITVSSNTITSYSNLVYSDNTSPELKANISDYWEEKTTTTINSKQFKESNFSNYFWNTNDGEELTLKKEVKFEINSNVIIGKNNKPFLEVSSQTNNFYSTYFQYTISKSIDQENWEIITNKEIEDELSLVFLRKNFKELISIYSLDVNSDDYLKVDIKLSKGDDNKKLEYTFEVNTNKENFMISNFSSTYNLEEKKFRYGFIIDDIFGQIKGIKLSAYQKNKLLFKEQYSKDKINIISNDEDVLIDKNVGDIDIQNHNNLYFVFQVTFMIHNSEQTKILTQNTENFKIGNVNFIDNFNSEKIKWAHYNWWVILVIVLLIVLLIIMFLITFFIKKNKDKINDVELEMAIWSKSHQDNKTGIQIFNKYLNQNIEPSVVEEQQQITKEEVSYHNENYHNDHQEEEKDYNDLQDNKNYYNDLQETEKKYNNFQEEENDDEDLQDNKNYYNDLQDNENFYDELQENKNEVSDNNNDESELINNNENETSKKDKNNKEG